MIEYYKSTIFTEKIWKKVLQKLVPDQYLIMVDRNMTYAFKKLLLLLLFLKPASIDGDYYETQKGPGNSNQSLFRLPNMIRNFLSLVNLHLAIFDVFTESFFCYSKNHN